MNYVFIEKFGTVCSNLFSTNTANNAIEALTQAKTFARGGEVIQIEGNFMYSENKIVGIEINCGGQLYKNAEGCYDYEDVRELIASAVPCKQIA